MDWRSLDAIHLMINHRNYSNYYFYYNEEGIHKIYLCDINVVDPRYKEIPLFDESNIKTYPYPFGELAREIVDELEKEPWYQKLNTKKE